MSLFAEIQAAATEAQSVLAQLHGMGENDGGNFLYGPDNAKFTGVFGSSQVVELPQIAGGYLSRIQLPLTVTRTQTEFRPEVKAKLVRLSPRETYTIDHIDTSDALHWLLMLVKTGPR